MPRYIVQIGGKYLVDTNTNYVVQILHMPDWQYRSTQRDTRISALQAAWAWDALEFA